MDVPMVAHFAYTSPANGRGIDFSLIHYCAVASALTYGKVDEVRIHTTAAPVGYWWDRAKKLARVVKTSVPEKRFNSTFNHPAHQADAIRLTVLERYGGAFLDLDILTLRPLKPLYTAHRAVLGMEDEIAICPAVVIAPPGAPFIARWIAGYDSRTSEWSGFRSTGRDEYWGELSTRYPVHLASRYPDEVSVQPPSAFYPVHWRRAATERLYRPPAADGLSPKELDQSYTIHLWETGQWAARLRELNVQEVRAADTTLCRLIAPLLEVR